MKTLRNILLPTALLMAIFAPGVVNAITATERLRCLGTGGGVSGAVGDALGVQNSFTCLLVRFQNLLDGLIPLLATLALVGFFYGLAKYVFNAGNEESRKEAKQVIIAGIVALFLMAAIGGIINFLLDATGTDSGILDRNKIPVPTLPAPGGDGIE